MPLLWLRIDSWYRQAATIAHLPVLLEAGFADGASVSCMRR